MAWIRLGTCNKIKDNSEGRYSKKYRRPLAIFAKNWVTNPWKCEKLFLLFLWRGISSIYFKRKSFEVQFSYTHLVVFFRWIFRENKCILSPTISPCFFAKEWTEIGIYKLVQMKNNVQNNHELELSGEVLYEIVYFKRDWKYRTMVLELMVPNKPKNFLS